MHTIIIQVLDLSAHKLSAEALTPSCRFKCRWPTFFTLYDM